GRVGPRPLRRPIMEGVAPTCIDVDDCTCLSSVPPPQAGQRGEKESSARHRNPACPESGKPSLTNSPGRQTDLARIADAGRPTLTICQSSARSDRAERCAELLAAQARFPPVRISPFVPESARQYYCFADLE